MHNKDRTTGCHLLSFFGSSGCNAAGEFLSEYNSLYWWWSAGHFSILLDGKMLLFIPRLASLALDNQYGRA